MTGSTHPYEPHPYVGGRNAVLRALAAWHMEWPGAPRVVLLTGSPGTGRTRVLTGFTMLCDPEQRRRLPLDRLDPVTVPPDSPPPVLLSPAGRTTAELLAQLVRRCGLTAYTHIEDVCAALAARADSVVLVVPDVDRAGPVGPANEPARVVGELLAPLAVLPNLRLLAEMPSALARELAEGLPPGAVQLIDLDEARWSDPEGLVHQAEVLLDPDSGAPELPYTVDPAERRALVEALVARVGAGAGSRLTVRLAISSALAQADHFKPHEESVLPADLDEALDMHAQRMGVDPGTLRLLLRPLALAEPQGLPSELLGPLASAIAERDVEGLVEAHFALLGPFVETLHVPYGVGRPVVQSSARPGDESDAVAETSGTRIWLRLAHPALGQVLRSSPADVRGLQARVAMTLLERVPEQDWARADSYIRDHIASHALAAGLLPQLLTDPSLFVHADPVCLRAAVESVPYEVLGAAARTYRRTAPLLTRGATTPQHRAGLLATAFADDGMPQHAAVLRRLTVQAG